MIVSDRDDLIGSVSLQVLVLIDCVVMYLKVGVQDVTDDEAAGLGWR
jgi:hypothetical protein